MTSNQTGRTLIGIVSFSPDAYEGLRDNAEATAPAIAVVVIATVLSALGGMIWARFSAAPPETLQVDVSHFFLNSMVLGSLIQIAMWFAWVTMTWWFLRYGFVVEPFSWLSLVRTMGFAFAPMALQILVAFPVLEFPIGMMAVGATFGCSVLAVRAATGAPPGAALLATFAGFALFTLALGVLGNTDTDLAPGIFALDPNAISVALQLRTR